MWKIFLLGLVFFVAGCSGFSAMWKAGTTPDEEDPAQRTPIMKIFDGVTKVLTNPTNIEAWGTAIAGAITIILAGVGVKKAKKVAQQKAEKAAAKMVEEANKSPAT